MTAAGCSSSTPGFEPVNLNSSDIAEKIVLACDTDGDGMLTAEELAKVPGMTEAFHVYDTNSDGKVTADDIAARIDIWNTMPRGVMPVRCQVLVNGRPIEGALVRLVPEKFFADSIQPAEGMTDAEGFTSPARGMSATAEPAESGAYIGIYRVEITHPSKKIPPRYNTQTKLGLEVAPDSRTASQTVFHLKG